MANTIQLGPVLLDLGNLLTVSDINGPASYTNGTGNAVSARAFGMDTLKSLLPMGLSASGNYYAKVISVAGRGKPTMLVKWFVASTNAEVANAVNLSAEVLTFQGMGH
jgi:hypothetical protein